MKKILGCTLILLGVSGCGLLSDAKSYSREYSLDGLKLIAPAIDDPIAPGTFGQATYTVKPQQRLLLRFESFTDHTEKVDASEEKKVRLQITLQDTERKRADEGLQLCALTQNWMMGSTWEFANPYSPSGRWNPAGGAFDPASCVKPMEQKEKAEENDTVIFFDVTRWFLDYARGRGINYGWILMAEASSEITIVGETSGTYSPRLRFDRFFDPIWPRK